MKWEKSHKYTHSIVCMCATQRNKIGIYISQFLTQATDFQFILIKINVMNFRWIDSIKWDVFFRQTILICFMLSFKVEYLISLEFFFSQYECN